MYVYTYPGGRNKTNDTHELTLLLLTFIEHVSHTKKTKGKGLIFTLNIFVKVNAKSIQSIQCIQVL